MLKQTALLKALPWGTNFTVALDDEWEVIEHPELPNIPYMKEHHTTELLSRNFYFDCWLTQVVLGHDCGTTDHLFITVPKNVTLETFYDFIDTIS